MKRIGIYSSTRAGHTKHIAEHLAALLQLHGFDTELRNLRGQGGSPSLNDCAGVILAASIHVGKHEAEMVDFATKHRAELDALPSLFLSVSLGEVGAERATATAKEQERYAADVQRMIDAFVAETGWRPARMKPVAGALMYSKYNVFVRFIMRRIAKKEHADTDTSRDYEYTDWNSLDRVVEEFAANIVS
jgi:menaquinone-dependent protoporphyrinogen oxidase